MTLGRRSVSWPFIVLPLVGVLVSLTVPVALVGTNVRLAFSSLPVYTYAIDNFDASAKTGIAREQLVEAMQGLIDYFGSSEELITTTVVTLEGVEEPLFNEREALHFRDVKDLLNRVHVVQTVAVAMLASAAIAAAVAGLSGRTSAALELMRGMRFGAYGTIGVVIALGIFAAVGAFDALFVAFHQLSFDNDLWRGQVTDRMVQLFPSAFFFQGSLLIGLGAVLEASLIVGVTTVAMRTVIRRHLAKVRQAQAVTQGEHEPVQST